MDVFLAHAGNGTPLGSVGCFVGTTLCAIVSIWFSICVFSPALRAKVRWGRRGRGGPMSALSCAAWAFAAIVWGLILYAQGIRYEPGTKITGWLIATALIAVLGAAIHDCMQNDD